MGDGMDPDTPERREINRVARLLIAECERVEHCRLAASFADMARVVIADRAARSADMEARIDSAERFGQRVVNDMADMEARIRALADEWNETPDYNPSEYDQGRVDQRHDMCGQLFEVLALLDAAPAGGGE